MKKFLMIIGCVFIIANVFAAGNKDADNAKEQGKVQIRLVKKQ